MSDPHWVTDAELRQLLATGADDAAVCDAFDRLIVSWNAETAAKCYLAAVGYIAYQRPHVAERVLSLPIDALLQAGAESAAAVMQYVEQLTREPDTWFAECAGPNGLRWLQDEFPRLTALVGRVFEDRLRDLERRLQALD